jgi:hypothetical protein
MAKLEGLATWVPQSKTVYVVRRAWRGRALCEADERHILIPRSELRIWRSVMEIPAEVGAPLLRPFDSSDLDACASPQLR